MECKFLCCCGASPNHVCYIIGCVCLLFAFAHFCNFVPFFCILTAVPHCLIMLVMILAGGLLIAGVSYNKPVLLVLFPWVMIACILLQIVNAILLYVCSRCLSAMLLLLFSKYGSITVGYALIVALAGVNLSFSVYSLLLVSCMVREFAMEQRQVAAERHKPNKSPSEMQP